MSSPQAPTPPDPNTTAAAAAAQNQKTAVTQFGLNAVNQNAPQGSLSYKQIGAWEDGTPRFEATTGLNPGEQQVYDTDLSNRQKLGTIGNEAITRVGGLLAKPVDLSNPATEARTIELARNRLDPIFALRRDQLQNQLVNQGITDRGSEAWKNAMDDYGRQENDAYNQLLLTGHGQAVSDILAERNQPINEITALQSGSQVSQPNFTNTPQSNVAPVDYAGIVNNNYQGQMAKYSADQQKMGALYGAIGGAAGTALGGWGMGAFKMPKFGMA
jgi:hypothetical protein